MTGVLIGVLTATAIQFVVPCRPKSLFGGPMAPWKHGGVQQHLQRELNLTDDQNSKLAPIIADFQGKIIRSRTEHLETIERAVTELEQAVGAQLNTEQQKKLKKMHKRFEKIRSRMGPPPGP